jgi:hypothetical protein
MSDVSPMQREILVKLLQEVLRSLSANLQVIVLWSESLPGSRGGSVSCSVAYCEAIFSGAVFYKPNLRTPPSPTLKTLRSLPVPRSVCANPCRDCIRTTNERSDLHVEGRSGTSSPCTSPGARLLANDEMAHAVANRLNGGTRVHNVALLLPRGHPK